MTHPYPLPPARTAGRYGLALASVATAFGLSHAFLLLEWPLPFAALALCAIAVTFWYGGNRPGVLAAMLSAVVRTFFFEPDVPLVSRLAYDFVFLIFAVLMTQATRARDELEGRVAERTAALTRVNDDLRLEIAERARAEDELRRSEAYLSEAQRLSHTGSFAFDLATSTIVHWSLEHFRMFGFDPEAGLPSFDVVAARIHPDDREGFAAIWERAIREAVDVDQECRIVLPDGTMKYIHGVGHPVFNAAGAMDRLVGTVVDVTELRRVDHERERLRQVQADLMHISRVTTMGELTASLAHEVNQPIGAAVTDAKTCLRWLERATPEIDEARQAAARVVADVTRAAEIVSRIRLLFTKGAPQREAVDVNDVVREMIVMLRGEAARHGISVRTELATEAPRVAGDRVQLQQVVMNLILNSIDSMKDAPGTRELVLKSRPTDEGVVVEVSDTGPGVPARHAGEIFNAFFTTKAQGTGMGLSISRSIVESHGGTLWAADNLPRGASFLVNLPAIVETNEPADRRTDGLHHR